MFKKHSVVKISIKFEIFAKLNYNRHLKFIKYNWKYNSWLNYPKSEFREVQKSITENS